MITTPEIICDLFSFLDKDQIERMQLVNQLWNNIIIRHKNILPLRQFKRLQFIYNEYGEEDYLIEIYALEQYWNYEPVSYKIKFDGTNLSKIEFVSSPYSQLTVDEVLTNLNDVVFCYILIQHFNMFEYNSPDYFLNMMKLVTAKTGGRFCGKFGVCRGRFGSILDEIFDNYIIVDELTLLHSYGLDSYIREVCANPEIVELPSTPKKIRLRYLEFAENDEVLHFTCNGKLNGANRLTIGFEFSKINYGNFIRQWFELYRTHQNPISLVGKFECRIRHYYENIVYEKAFDDSFIVLDAVKAFLTNTQLNVKYSLERFYEYGVTDQYLNRRCVLHEADSFALVIEMAYKVKTDMSSINASDLDQPPCNQMETISFCVKLL